MPPLLGIDLIVEGITGMIFEVIDDKYIFNICKTVSSTWGVDIVYDKKRMFKPSRTSL